LYSIGNITQGIDIAGIFAVDGTITVQTTQDDSILHTLDLNTIVQAAASTAPFLYTNVITNATSTTATSGGNSINDYGSAITAKGVEWSTTSNFAPPVGSTSDGTGSSNYSSAITGLTASNTYFVRAYATNGIGTGYGQVIQFSTSATPLANPAGASTTSSNGACNSSDLTYNFYFEENIIVEGATVYTNSSLGNIFVGDSGWYRVDSVDATRAMQINNFGKIIGFMALCP
jgi:hypothetical protein